MKRLIKREDISQAMRVSKKLQQKYKTSCVFQMLTVQRLFESDKKDFNVKRSHFVGP